MIDAYVELGSLPPGIGSKTDGADGVDAIRRADAGWTASRNRAAQVLEPTRGICRGWELRQEFGGNGVWKVLYYIVGELRRFHRIDRRGCSGLPQAFKGSEEK